MPVSIVYVDKQNQILVSSSKRVPESKVRDYHYSRVLKISRKQMDLGKKPEFCHVSAVLASLKLEFLHFFFYFVWILKSFCIVCPLFAHYLPSSREGFGIAC